MIRRKSGLIELLNLKISPGFLVDVVFLYIEKLSPQKGVREA
jgi:hypothetical protein